MAQQYDLFGNPIVEKGSLREKYGVNPFTILDAKDGVWAARKRKWIQDLGIKSEVGRDAKCFHTGNYDKWGTQMKTETSVFDPVLCEVMYRWYCPNGGKILDPFAGGSVRGIVAHYLGYNYTGIDIRQEQIDSNYEQATSILGKENLPNWIVGDSDLILRNLDKKNMFDLIFTCPPYTNMEVYSDMDGDISNMDYNDFIFSLESIMRNACKLLKVGGMAIIVVCEVRNKQGNYYGFVADTIKAFKGCAGMAYYNEAILATPIGTAAFRADNNMIRGNGKLVKTHQNILMFKKTE